MKIFLLCMVICSCGLSLGLAKDKSTEAIIEKSFKLKQKILSHLPKSEEQANIFRECKRASKEAWASSTDKSKADDLLKAKVLATTIKAMELLDKGYPLDIAIALSKHWVEEEMARVLS